MGIMATSCSVHIVTAMATEKIEFFSTFRCRYRHSVNEQWVMKDVDYVYRETQ